MHPEPKELDDSEALKLVSQLGEFESASREVLEKESVPIKA